MKDVQGTLEATSKKARDDIQQQRQQSQQQQQGVYHSRGDFQQPAFDWAAMIFAAPRNEQGQDGFDNDCLSNKKEDNSNSNSNMTSASEDHIKNRMTFFLNQMNANFHSSAAVKDAITAQKSSPSSRIARYRLWYYH